MQDMPHALTTIQQQLRRASSQKRKADESFATVVWPAAPRREFCRTTSCAQQPDSPVTLPVVTQVLSPTSTTSSKVGPTSPRSPCHGSKAYLGTHRRQLEDTFTCLPNFFQAKNLHSARVDNPDDTLHLYAVFDGHGGTGAALHCASKLHGFLHKLLSALTARKAAPAAAPAVDSEQLLQSQTTDEALEQALTQAFLETDADLANHDVLPDCGSTAVVALVGDEKLWIAHCGDSRAVLCRDGKAVALTEDHRADRSDETARILSAGGLILWNGCQRVMGMLQTTRAIGDQDLKPYGVTPLPEVCHLTRDPLDQLLLLASDGLWEVLDRHLDLLLVSG